MEQAKKMIMDLNIGKEHIVAAISSGPDSMCLLDILVKTNYKIVVAHVNHNQRKESIEEENYLKEFCKKNKLIFESHTIIEYQGKNFQQEAREIRYKFFFELLKKYDSHYLFTAHHGDDLMETILMRITRGSTLKGYAGFEQISKDEDNYIVRPLISLTKEQIIEYNDKNNIKYFVDETNNQDNYTRNRYRHKIIPELKKEYGDVHLKYIEYSKNLVEANDYINKRSEEAKKEVYEGDYINLLLFNKYDEIIQKRIIMIILEKIYDDKINLIYDEHLHQIMYIAKKTSKPNVEIMLPNNLRAIKSYDKLYFELKNIETQDYYYIFDVDKELPNGSKLVYSKKDSKKSNNCLKLNSKKIVLPLIVRNRRNGDKIQIKNGIGHTKINKIFIDQKISIKNRELWPIVTDSANKILWIPGLKKSIYEEEENYDLVIDFLKRGKS